MQILNRQSKKVLIVAGEASGDMHAASLMIALTDLAQKNNLAPITFYGLGGKAMRSTGADPLINLEQVSVIGLFEVLRHLPKIWVVFNQLVKSLNREKPDIAILIDFPDFNLRLAEKIKKQNIPLVWYISPQVWAWRENRVHDLKRLVNLMLVLFPFEVDFYRQYGMEVTWVGHPLVDRVQSIQNQNKSELRHKLGFSDVPKIMALLPGSRRSELKMYLQPMLEAAQLLHSQNQDMNFVLPVASSLKISDIEKIVNKYNIPVKCYEGIPYELLYIADAAVVASGTATLETALIGTPMIILGKISRITELWLKKVAKLPYYGLVNFVLGKASVTELIQSQVTPENIFEEVNNLLYDEAEKNRLISCYKEVHRHIGPGGASIRAAEEVFKVMYC